MFADLTQETRNTLMVATLVGVLVLLYLEAKRAGWGVSVSKEGMYTSGAPSRLKGTGRSDLGSTNYHSASMSAEDRAAREGMGNEFPVFWNAGSFADVGAHHQGTIGSDSVLNEFGDLSGEAAKLVASAAAGNRHDGAFLEGMRAQVGYVENLVGAPGAKFGGQNLNPY